MLLFKHPAQHTGKSLPAPAPAARANPLGVLLGAWRREAEQAADSLRESLRQSLMAQNAKVHEAQSEAHSAQLQVGVQQRKMQEHIQQMDLLRCASPARRAMTPPPLCVCASGAERR